MPSASPPSLPRVQGQSCPLAFYTPGEPPGGSAATQPATRPPTGPRMSGRGGGAKDIRGRQEEAIVQWEFNLHSSP